MSLAFIMLYKNYFCEMVNEIIGFYVMHQFKKNFVNAFNRYLYFEIGKNTFQKSNQILICHRWLKTLRIHAILIFLF